MWKQCQSVLLPANKAENCILTHKNTRFAVFYPDKYFTQSYLEESNAKANHLYILSSDEIQLGDWFYVKTPNIHGGNIITQSTGNGKYAWKKHILTKYTDERGYDKSHCKKIIVSTDKSLNLPQIPQQFIENYINIYNSGNQIKDVLVEYHEYMESGHGGEFPAIKLKINQDNTINMKSLKNSYSRKEVIELLKNGFEYAREWSHISRFPEDGFEFDHDEEQLNKWIENNL